MTLFDILRIIVSRKGNREELKLLVETKSIPYSPFMINRWLSFLNPTVAQYINTFCNKRSYDSPVEHLLEIYALLPQSSMPSSMPRLQYIKKIKGEDEKEDPKVDLLSKSLEISKKEAKKILEG